MACHTHLFSLFSLLVYEPAANKCSLWWYFKYSWVITSNLRFGACCQEDYRRTVTEIDEKEYISLKIIVSELRNQYVSLCCRSPVKSDTSFFTANFLLFPPPFREGNVTRHDPEEHWEDQEASKQQRRRLVLMFAQPSQTPPRLSHFTFLPLTFPAVQLSSTGRCLDDHLHQNNQA